MIRSSGAVAGLLALGIATSAMACRYTVREIGFVNLQGRPWTVVEVTAGTDISNHQPADANVNVVRINPNVDPNHPAVMATGEKGGTVLLAPDGRTLLLDGADPLSQAITSPLRNRIAREALDTFAFVLMVPGTDEVENQRARALARTAEARLAALAPHLPRPVSTPLAFIELSAEQVQEERVLLWSMGLLNKDDDASLAVIYGRGRRAGSPLVGDFDETEFTTQLALVGESCECETNRAWLLEPTAPMRWPEAVAQRAPGSLGFDPASPMVQAEVSRILTRGGFGTGRNNDSEGRRPKDLAEIVFGYSEHTLEDRLGDTGRAAPPPAKSSQATESKPQVNLRRDEGWDFPSPEQTIPQARSEDIPEDPLDSSPWFQTILIGGLLVFVFSAAAAGFVLRR